MTNTANTNNAGIGFTDLPATTDDLSFKAYCSGLADFLAECATPMTVAVQGSWGAGKTTIMNLVEEDLKKLNLSGHSIGIIRFETWQYSQFSMGDDLVTSLISTLGLRLSELATEQDEKGISLKGVTAMFKSLSRLGRSAGFAAAKAAASHLPQIAGDSIRAALTEIEPDDTRAPGDAATALRELKDGFEAAVKDSGYSRIVVFIDDLDRMSPERAVELMEAIKIFLDAENCVFVLAMDLDVVRAGSGARLGTKLDAQKAQAFFDKMVQVPFLVPETPDVSRFLKKGLERIGVAAESKEDQARFGNLVATSVGYNPRSIKRLLNTYVLLRKIARNRGDKKETADLDLFAVLCLQTAFQDEYTELQSRLQSAGNLTDSVDSEQEIQQALGVVVGEDGQKVGNPFADLFIESFSSSKNGEIELDRLRTVMDLSEVTSRTSGTTVVNPAPSAGNRAKMDLRATEDGLPAPIIEMANELVDGLIAEGVVRSVSEQKSNPALWNLYSEPNQAWGTKVGVIFLGRRWLTIHFVRQAKYTSNALEEAVRDIRDQIGKSKYSTAMGVQIGQASGAEFAIAASRLRDKTDVEVLVPIISETLRKAEDGQ